VSDQTEPTAEITLRIDLPDVVEAAYRIEVRCGETTCDVHEHGHRGSGDWAAWTGQSIINDGGKRGYSLAQALADARAHVREHERSRLAFAEVRRALQETATAPQPAPGAPSGTDGDAGEGEAG